MSRQARHASKAIRQSARAMQHLLQQVRPITPGEITVVRHLIQPVIAQRHYCDDVYCYLGSPGRWGPCEAHAFTRRRQYTLSAELARRARRWEQQLTGLQVYHDVCHMCEACGRYVRLFVPMHDDSWPPGTTLHVTLDALADDYPAVRREIGWMAYDPHLIVSEDLERVHGMII